MTITTLDHAIEPSGHAARSTPVAAMLAAMRNGCARLIGMHPDAHERALAQARDEADRADQERLWEAYEARAAIFASIV